MQKVAIYSRKSKFTGKGDSIENQIQLCKEYAEKNLGKCEFIIYEDEGFTGSNTNRPEFQKLLSDVKNKQFNVLICYRLDRISRSVADFSQTLGLLQDHNIEFVSIREQFDTSTPMGRAMIYIASVFAQLERETIAERVRDNMLELAKNGRWTGGKIPLGFNSEKINYTDDAGLQREYTKLISNDEESKFVKFLYEKYLELGSLHKLEVYITQNQIKSRNGILFEKSTLKIILQNPVYVKSSLDVIEYLKNNNWNIYGESDNIHSLLTYNKTEQGVVNGKHIKVKKSIEERFAAVSNIQGFIEPELWLDVQKQFDRNRDTFPRLGKGKTHKALLTGKLKCGHCKEYMLVSHGKVSKTTGEKMFYYICSMKRKSKGSVCKNSNAKAAEVENLVILGLKSLGESKEDYIKTLEAKYNSNEISKKTSMEKTFLEKSLSEKKEQINVLVDKLSKSQGIEDIIMDKIKLLKSECMEIDKKISSLEDYSKQLKNNKMNLEIIKEYTSQCKTIDTLSKDKQKKIIEILVDTIYWFGDGNNKGGTVKLKFIGADEDNEEIEYPEESSYSGLQFGSHSTCKVIENATYKEIFQPLENSSLAKYSSLPEKNISEKLYKIRKINGYSRREFAKLCNIGYSSVVKYETGLANPSRYNIIKISEKVNKSLDYFGY